MRYTLTETEHGQAWGACAEADGLFGEPERGIYELSGWVPQAQVHGWVGDRVWLVPDDETLDPWLLEDAERIRAPRGPRGSEALVLSGLDDYEGPPEGHRGRVRVHDGHRWLGSCQEFARVRTPEQAAPPLVLRGLAPSDQLRRALTKSSRKALALEEAALYTHLSRALTPDSQPQGSLRGRAKATLRSSHAQLLENSNADISTAQRGLTDA